MQDCATQPMRFDTQTALALEAAFDGGRLTSDGGLVWLSEMDEELGLCERISEHVPEWRKRKGRHSLASLIKQRVFQIACGYEDQNDADALRQDPLLKMVCGSLPEGGPDLASQPTICRLENAASMRSCYQIAEILFDLYLSQREKDGAPRAGASGFRLDGRPHPRRAGRQLLPWLLPTAHLPSAARLRRPQRAPDHDAFESGQHPLLPLLCGRLEAHRGSL